MQDARVLKNEMLAEVHDMPGVFLDYLESKVHTMANAVIIEADTFCRAIFQCRLLSILWGFLLQIFLEEYDFLYHSSCASVRLSDWESEKVFQQP